jgi:hypothetical protein
LCSSLTKARFEEVSSSLGKVSKGGLQLRHSALVLFSPPTERVSWSGAGSRFCAMSLEVSSHEEGTEDESEDSP